MNLSTPIVPLSANMFSNKVADNVPSNILKNPHFCPFASFLIVSPRLLINKLDSSRGLNNFHDIIYFFIRKH